VSLLLLAGGTAATLLADQASKHALTSRSGRARIVHNRRGAPVALEPRSAAVVLGVVAAVAAVLARQAGPTTAIGLGLLVGGACGNLVDRVRRGAVVDFVAAGWWPVFNLADAAMVVGIGIALVGVL
jgi:hypothetical protein